MMDGVKKKKKRTKNDQKRKYISNGNLFLFVSVTTNCFREKNAQETKNLQINAGHLCNKSHFVLPILRK